MVIKLNTIKDVDDFVSICNNCNNGYIDVKQGRNIVDGKSKLGIYSLNLMEPINVETDSKNVEAVFDFYDSLKGWAVNVGGKNTKILHG